jgi:hypothetical protein
MKSVSTFLHEHKIDSQAKLGAPADPTFDGSTGWTVTLSMGKKSMETPFYMGMYHKGTAPTTAMVLDSLIGDARGLEDTVDFKGWCNEYGDEGNDPDEPNAKKDARRIYAKVKSLSAKLKKFLGPATYRDAIDNVEPE